MKKKTLLLVFIHGFKGGDQTFQRFPQDLRALLQHTFPLIEVVSAVYPPYETRGDLGECVSRFTEWLQNQVIDLEVANDSRASTVDPSVHVVLCGHSMGGIVAAETLLKIAQDHALPVASGSDNHNSTTPSNPIPSNEPLASSFGQQQSFNATEPISSSAGNQANLSSNDTSTQQQSPLLLFPNIRAILAFDTPYLGISPGVLAHGAEEQLAHASSAYKAWDSASQFFGKSGWGGSGAAKSEAAVTPAADTTAAAGNSSGGGSAWAKWGKYAAVGGAAAAALAGAAGAAYYSREHISQGIAWAGSHLEFVGCLARGAELQRRVERVVEVGRVGSVGFADFYTVLGDGAQKKKGGNVAQGKEGQGVLGSYASASGTGEERTFCVVPKSAREGAASSANPSTAASSTPTEDDEANSNVQAFAEDSSRSKGQWVKCVNHAAADEVTAHTAMFTPADNRDYHDMLPRARDWIAEWIDRGWYESAACDEDS